jgi:RNA recognition motif-containing protein
MQGSKLYVGNLTYNVTAEELVTLFSEHGTVINANIIEGKGFGFIEMSNQSEAEGAKKVLDGALLKGRALRVNEAQTRKNRHGHGRRGARR